MNEDDELNIFMEEKINNLAALFYHMNGRVFSLEIDFRNSSHPEERRCWNMSIVAHSFINEDNGLLAFQSD